MSGKSATAEAKESKAAGAAATATAATAATARARVRGVEDGSGVKVNFANNSHLTTLDALVYMKPANPTAATGRSYAWKVYPLIESGLDSFSVPVAYSFRVTNAIGTDGSVTQSTPDYATGFNNTSWTFDGSICTKATTPTTSDLQVLNMSKNLSLCDVVIDKYDGKKMSPLCAVPGVLHDSYAAFTLSPMIFFTLAGHGSFKQGVGFSCDQFSAQEFGFPLDGSVPGQFDANGDLSLSYTYVDGMHLITNVTPPPPARLPERAAAGGGPTSTSTTTTTSSSTDCAGVVTTTVTTAIVTRPVYAAPRA